VYRGVQICTFGDSIEGKLVTVVDELKGSDCGNEKEDTERMTSLRSHDLNKLRMSNKKTRSCLNMMKDSKHLMMMLLMKLMSGTNGFSKSLKTFSLSEVYAMYIKVVNWLMLIWENEETGENEERGEDDEADDNEV
jgi:hypothetical protein